MSSSGGWAPWVLIRTRLRLPRNASHYRYVDISREPPDGNPNHSGESVLRVPLAKLSRG